MLKIVFKAARWFRQLVLTFAIILLLVCAAEVGLQYCAHRTSWDQGGTGGDAGWMQDNGRTGTQLVPTAISGKSGTTLRINGRGLRGDEITIPKPAGRYRVLCLGDEWVLAPRMDDAATFSSLLERQLQSRTELPLEVVNAGTPGYSPLQSFLWLRHEGVALQPDVVILHVEPNDFHDDERVRAYVINDDDGIPLLCPLGDSDERSERGEASFWMKTQLGTLVRAACLEQLTGDGETRRSRPRALTWQPPAGEAERLRGEQLLETLQHTQDLTERLFARLIIVAHPGRPVVGEGPYAGPDLDATWIGELSRFCVAQQIPLLIPSLSGNGDRRTPLLTAAEHQEYAGELANFLNERVAGPWNSSYFGTPVSPTTPIAAPREFPRR